MKIMRFSRCIEHEVKMKDIVIISDFCGNFDEKSNNRFITISKMFSEEFEVELVTSDFYHGNKSRIRINEGKYSFKITLLHEKDYKKNISLKRFFAHYCWGKEVYKYLKRRKKPDVVYCAVPTLYAPYLISKYCKKNGIPFAIDVQDIWPDAFKMVFTIPVISNIMFYPLKVIANNIYSRADLIIAVSKTYLDRALMNNKDSVNSHVVFLGTNLDEFDIYKNDNSIEIEKKDELWIGYCGSLSASYDLSCIIDALALIGDDHNVLVVMGDGPKREEFEKRAQEKGIQFKFTGRLSYKDMCCLLAKCDIAVNPISHRAAQSIINKHADYVAAGLPIVNTQENEEFRNLIDYYDMGLNCNNGDAKDLADKLLLLINSKDARERMGKNARRCAEELFDRKKTYQIIKKEIKQL